MDIHNPLDLLMLACKQRKQWGISVSANMDFDFSDTNALCERFDADAVNAMFFKDQKVTTSSKEDACALYDAIEKLDASHDALYACLISPDGEVVKERA